LAQWVDCKAPCQVLGVQGGNMPPPSCPPPGRTHGCRFQIPAGGPQAPPFLQNRKTKQPLSFTRARRNLFVGLAVLVVFVPALGVTEHKVWPLNHRPPPFPMAAPQCPKAFLRARGPCAGNGEKGPPPGFGFVPHPRRVGTSFLWLPSPVSPPPSAVSHCAKCPGAAPFPPGEAGREKVPGAPEIGEKSPIYPPPGPVRKPCPVGVGHHRRGPGAEEKSRGVGPGGPLGDFPPLKQPRGEENTGPPPARFCLSPGDPQRPARFFLRGVAPRGG